MSWLLDGDVALRTLYNAKEEPPTTSGDLEGDAVVINSSSREIARLRGGPDWGISARNIEARSTTTPSQRWLASQRDAHGSGSWLDTSGA